jgi:transcriptional regulator with XRE-family HTH domain
MMRIYKMNLTEEQKRALKAKKRRFFKLKQNISIGEFDKRIHKNGHGTVLVSRRYKNRRIHVRGIYIARKVLNINEATMAKILGLPQHVYRQYEHGKRELDKDPIKKITKLAIVSGLVQIPGGLLDKKFYPEDANKIFKFIEGIRAEELHYAMSFGLQRLTKFFRLSIYNYQRTYKKLIKEFEELKRLHRELTLETAKGYKRYKRHNMLGLARNKM